MKIVYKKRQRKVSFVKVSWKWAGVGGIQSVDKETV